MTRDFARIVRTSSGAQVLFAVDFDTDDDRWVLRCTCQSDGINSTMSIGFGADGEAQAFAALDKCDEAMADALWQGHLRWEPQPA